MKFNKALFRTSGDFLIYNDTVVARFKRGGLAHFRNFLIKNFTVEEYFDAYDNTRMAPLEILETKGYMHPNVEKALKAAGFPITPTGLEDYLHRSFLMRAGI